MFPNTQIILVSSNSVVQYLDSAPLIKGDRRSIGSIAEPGGYAPALTFPSGVKIRVQLPFRERGNRRCGNQLWKLLIDRSMPIRDYCPHGPTLIARMVEHAPPEFLRDLLDSPIERFQRNKESVDRMVTPLRIFPDEEATRAYSKSWRETASGRERQIC